VEPSSFESSEFGVPRWAEEGKYWWFDPAPIARSIPLEPETQLALSDADTALGRLSGVGGMLRDPRLLLRPYATREALASARIEGTQARLDEVYQAQASQDAPRDRDVAEVTAHIAALEHGLSLAQDRLDFATLREVHSILMSGTHGGAEPGELRQVPVWLGSPTERPETAVFVPPVGDTMIRALASWESFLNDPPRLPVLLRAALLHYQFLTVHPFIDGNGRVGRILILLFLRRENKLAVPLLYVSPYFAARRREYFDRLQAVRERGELQQWLQFFLTAVASQAEDGVIRARELLDLRERYRTELSSSRSRAIYIVELLFTNPILTTALIKRHLEITTQGALNLLRGLESRGWLVEVGSSGRGGATQWLARDVFTIVAREEEQTSRYLSLSDSGNNQRDVEY
jgi:Fic family protein